jgi:hypothetical protein
MEMITKAIEAKIQASGLNWLRLQDLRFSPKTKSITAELLLDGEERPLEVKANYRLDGEAVVIESVETSKKWITEALQLALLKHGGRVPLPTGMKGKLIKMFL